MDGQITDLQSALVYVLSGGGAGAAAYWVAERWPAVQQLGSEAKRYALLALTAAFAWLAWLVAIAMLFLPAPADWRAWVQQAFSVALAAYLASQLIHGRAVLSAKPKPDAQAQE